MSNSYNDKKRNNYNSRWKWRRNNKRKGKWKSLPMRWSTKKNSYNLHGKPPTKIKNIIHMIQNQEISEQNEEWKKPRHGQPDYSINEIWTKHYVWCRASPLTGQPWKPLILYFTLPGLDKVWNLFKSMKFEGKDDIFHNLLIHIYLAVYKNGDVSTHLTWKITILALN